MKTIRISSCLAVCLVCLLPVTSAQAADVYWRLFTDGVDELSVTELETHLALVLGRTEQRHLNSEKALSERLRTLPLQMP
ncbi:MAG: hypothetical protein RBU37_25560, partial [Myxococcota bacterium]|nr:hypothetical protein [Myxococcota bacterium]